MSPEKPMQSDEVEFVDALNRDWTDISSEDYRKYIFPTGREIFIQKPLKLLVTDSGGHRIFSAVDGGMCFYINPGWIAIEWKVGKGQPHFVK